MQDKVSNFLSQFFRTQKGISRKWVTLHKDEEDKGRNKEIHGVCHAAHVDQGKVLAICVVPSNIFTLYLYGEQGMRLGGACVLNGWCACFLTASHAIFGALLSDSTNVIVYSSKLQLQELSLAKFGQ
jgi:hypothetical protein